MLRVPKDSKIADMYLIAYRLFFYFVWAKWRGGETAQNKTFYFYT